jgi:two-component system KDP operon response regulator KdpE
VSNPASILIVDDEVQMRRLLRISLEAEGYKVHQSANAEEALSQSSMARPELIVLDLGLPDMDGIEVLKKVREWSSVPILVLSARTGEQDIVAALDAGADDYLTKPFRGGELLARVRTALRHRPTSIEGSVFTHGSVSVDLEARIVKKGDSVVQLTPTEYSLLALLVRNAGKVLTHKYLLREIWGPAFEDETQYTRIYVGQLRKKLEDDPASPTLLRTESGIGYRLAMEE